MMPSASEFSSGQGSYFRFELKKATVGFFSSCSGLSSELSVVKHKTMTADGKQVETRQPNKRSFSEVVLKRGYTSNTDLYDWFKKTVDAGANVERSEASIVVLDRDLEEIARFNLEQCFPSKLSISDLGAKSDDAVVEELTIRHENLVWA
jgi:phage tail-like protein